MPPSLKSRGELKCFAHRNNPYCNKKNWIYAVHKKAPPKQGQENLRLIALL